MAGTCPTCGQPREQLTREALVDMTPRQIEDARRAGQLDEVLTGRTGATSS